MRTINKVTTREFWENETVVLSALRKLDPNWEYIGQIGRLKYFKLYREE